MTNEQERIKKLRKSRGFTQKEMAMLLGISQQAYQQLEAGRTEDMRISTLKKLCLILDISADYLLGIEERGNGSPYVIITELQSGERSYKIDWDKMLKDTSTIRKLK